MPDAETWFILLPRWFGGLGGAHSYHRLRLYDARFLKRAAMPVIARFWILGFLFMLFCSFAEAGDPPEFLLEWGTQGNEEGQLTTPHGIVVAVTGDVYVADTGNNRIQKFSSVGTFITAWGSFGAGIGQFNHPHGIAVDRDGNVYVGETGNYRIQKFTSDGIFIATWGTQGSGDGQFLHLHDLAVDAARNAYATDRDTHRVQKFTSDGTFVTKWGSFGVGNGQFNQPNGVAVDEDGNVYVADTSSRIQKFTSNGTFLLRWGTAGAGDGQFNFPRGMSADGLGHVFVADRDNQRIQMFTAEGSVITKWGAFGLGPGQFNYPYAVAADASGNVYVADSSNNRIQRFVFVHSGRVPDGSTVPGTPLTVNKGNGDEITLTWGASCLSTDTDYEVYEGSLGGFASHTPRFCTTGRATMITFQPALGNTYYLVVPRTAVREGSYGTQSNVVQRPQGVAPCLPQSIAACE